MKEYYFFFFFFICTNDTKLRKASDLYIAFYPTAILFKMIERRFLFYWQGS